MVLRLLTTIGTKKWHGPWYTRNGVLFLTAQNLYRVFQQLGTAAVRPLLFLLFLISVLLFIPPKHLRLTFGLRYSGL